MKIINNCYFCEKDVDNWWMDFVEIRLLITYVKRKCRKCGKL